MTVMTEQTVVPKMVAPKTALPTLLIWGVGLIGGSFALALKQAGQVQRVLGIGRSASNMAQALAMGVIDEVVTDVGAAIARADVILLGTPVGQMPALMPLLEQHLQPHTLVMDAGSTKSDVLAYAQQHLPQHLAQFVPAHPIAGAEHSGAAAAKADLYQQKTVVLCPQPAQNPEALAQARALWQACGALVQHMSPSEHDAVFAAVSHLPHLLAFALVDEIAQRGNAATLFGFAASGFRDFTRIASSHPEMWRDISLANRAALLDELAAYQRALTAMQQELQAADGEALMQRFSHARDARNAWLASKLEGQKA